MNMNVNKWKTIALIIEIFGGILVLLGQHRYKLFLYIGVPVLLSGIILEIIKWRCPYCGKHFFGKGKIIYKCPYCNSDIHY